MTRRLWLLIVALGLLGTLLTALPRNASAQVGGSWDGDYVGTIGATGGFRVNTPEANIYMHVVYSTGRFEVHIENGGFLGDWTMSGATTVAGTLGPNGSMTGHGTFDFTGFTVGTVFNPNLMGTNNWTNNIAINVGGVGFADSYSGQEPFQEQVTNLRVLCGFLMGKYDQRISQEIDAMPGFTEYLTGYITARRVGPSKLEADIGAMAADIRAWAGNASEAETAGEITSSGLRLADRMQDLERRVAQEQDCPPEATFVNELTMAVQDALRTLMSRFPGSITYREVVLGMQAGAIGAGSASPEEAAEIQAAMESDLEQQFGDAIEQTPLDQNKLVDIAMAARALGMETIGGELTPQEVLIVITGEG